MKINVIDSNNLINKRVSHSGLDHLVIDFVTFLLICIYSFYPVLHVAVLFFSQIQIKLCNMIYKIVHGNDPQNFNWDIFMVNDQHNFFHYK